MVAQAAAVAMALTHVLVLYNLMMNSAVDDVVRTPATAVSLASEEEVGYTAQLVAEAIRAKGVYEVEVVGVRTVGDIERALAGRDARHTLVFNMVEALEGQSRLHIVAARTIDSLGFMYTGAGATALEVASDKATAKRLFQQANVMTPAFQVFTSESDALLSVPTPTPARPLIVKPLYEDASLGISKHESVVQSEAALRERVRALMATYGAPALAEQFVDGREFTVAVLGTAGSATTLPLVEVDLSLFENPLERILDYDAKWNEQSASFRLWNVVCPVVVDEQTAQLIAHAAVNAYRATGVRDYGRVDVRVQDGVVYVLEVNPNPCLYPSGMFSTAAAVAGMDFAALINHIVDDAWSRYPTDDMCNDNTCVGPLNAEL